jgi:general secretion pathway protein L
MVVLAALLILLAVGWGGGSIISQQVYLSRLNGEIARLGVEVKKIEQTRKECKAVEDRIDYLSRLFGAGAPVLDVLKELSLRIPKTAWVTSLDLSDGDVKIEGRADASSELIPALDASPLFSNVAFISSIIRGQAGNEMFRIGLKVGK